MTVIYEVNLEVDRDLGVDFAAWLPDHVEDMLALPGFVDAVIARERRDPNQLPAWSVRYRLIDFEALDHYFSEHADSMRQAGLKRFGNRLTASRRILTEE